MTTENSTFQWKVKVIPWKSQNMDKKNFQRLVRGKLDIDGRLDLHGLTQEQAKIVLRSKLMQAHGRGKRLILVITGKGKQRTDEFNRQIVGVLRQNVPMWLRQAPLSSIVLEVTSAQQRHGGALGSNRHEEAQT